MKNNEEIIDKKQEKINKREAKKAQKEKLRILKDEAKKLKKEQKKIILNRLIYVWERIRSLANLHFFIVLEIKI